jgi:dihydrofolate synthase/folylpolyglutamate synthase
MENAALAVMALGVLDQGRRITVSDLQEAVEKCFWQGRMEEIRPNVYVDGAHNEDGIRAFLESVREDGCPGQRSLLFSVVQDKDYTNMIRQIMQSGLFSRIAIAHMNNYRATDTVAIEHIVDEYRIPGTESKVFEDVKTALNALLEMQAADEYIYIAGSLYLVGEIKELI